MLNTIAKLTLGFVSALSVLLAAASSLFCMSWYADKELQDVLTEDDAGIVDIIAAFCVLYSGIVLARIVWRRKGWLMGLASTLCADWCDSLRARSVVAAGTQNRCISLNAMLSFGLKVEPPAPRRHYNRTHQLAELIAAAEAIEEGRQVPVQLLERLDPGTSMGGARPKATIEDGGVLWIGKFPEKSDRFKLQRVEYATLELARHCGINTRGRGWSAVEPGWGGPAKVPGRGWQIGPGRFGGKDGAESRGTCEDSANGSRRD